MGVAVSVMAITDTELSAEEKTVFDWCKEGDLERVRAMLTSGAASVNGLDEEVNMRSGFIFQFFFYHPL